MAKFMELNADDKERLCLVAKALSSPTRIDIIKLLYTYSLNVGEIAERLGIPASSAGVHIKLLEEAELINTEIQPGERGAMKLCSRKNDLVAIRLNGLPQNVSKVETISMPVGAFTDCSVSPTCGLATAESYIGNEDQRACFYLPGRFGAQLLWTSSGYVEYKFPNSLPKGRRLRRLSLSAEICSEAPNYREDWKSDITLWICGRECGTWTCPGDFGARRGRLTPEWWSDGSSQYGLLTTWSVSEKGCSINGAPCAGPALGEVYREDLPCITVRIGNKPDATYIGGFNLYGRQYGDYQQDLLLMLEYAPQAPGESR